MGLSPTQLNPFIINFKAMLIKGFTKATNCCLSLTPGFEFT